MPVSATTNTAAIASQRSIAVSSDLNSKAMAELATGSRISRASDAAAEAAIGAKLRSTVGVLSQASRNTSQGASLIQVATDALKNIGTVLTRMKTLTTQVINGSLSDSDKMMAREEFLRLKELADNIANQTRWNGVSMLAGGAGKAVLGRNSVQVAGANAVGSAFAAMVNTDLTGAINGKVSSVNIGEYNNDVLGKESIKIVMQNGETFTNKGVVHVTTGGNFILTSTTDSDNTMKINFDNASVNTITLAGSPVAAFKSSLTTLLQGAVFTGTAVQDAGGTVSVLGAAASANAFTSTVTASDGINAKVSSVIVDPSATSPYAIGAIVVTLSDGSVYKNNSAFTATADANITLTNTANAKTIVLTQASSIAGITSAATLQSTLRTTLGSVSIHGTTNSGSITANGLGSDTSYGFTSVVRGSTGFISGSAKDASVVQDGNKYKVSVSVGNQTFTNTVEIPDNNGNLELISTSDSENKLVFEFGSSVTTSMTNAVTFNAGLRNFLGLQYATSPAQFKPDSGITGGTTGFDAVIAGASVTSGKYSVSYKPDPSGVSGRMKISDGVNVLYQPVTKGGQQNVPFANGVIVSLGESFSVSNPMGPRTFDVIPGEAMRFDFQVAEKAEDILTVKLTAASLSALNLTTIDIATQEAAQTASTLLDEALSAVNKTYANLGAQQKQLEVNKDVLASNITNMQSALSEFVDADVPEAMTRMTASSVQYQIASAMLVQANEHTQQLLAMTR